MPSNRLSLITPIKHIIIFLMLLSGNTVYAQLSGTYTIGGASPDYASFSAAVSALNSQGVSAPVTFNVRTGTYSETFTVNVISGSSATNTVTFQSETGNPLNVTLESTSFSDVVTLDGSDYITFKDLTIAYNGSSTYNAIQLQDDADYVTFRNCILYGTNSTSTSFSAAVIYHYETTNTYQSDYVTIENCEFHRGSFGIYNNSDSSPHADDWTVTGNSFEDHTSGAIYIDDNNNLTVSNNTVTSTVTGFTAIELYSCDIITVTGNTLTLTDARYGIDISNSNGTSGQYSLIANNMISMGGSYNSAMYGVYASSASYTNYNFNSFNIYPSSNYSYTSSIYMSGTITNSSVNIQNNIFAMTGGQSNHYCLYVSSSADVDNWDYNDYYTTGSSRVAYTSGFRYTLANLQSYTGKDANSLDIDPGYTSSTDLHTSETALAAGTAIAGFTEDIDGDIRQNPPYIGADEIAAPSVANDAAVTALVSPVFPPCVGSNAFEVEVTNYGTNTLTSVTVNWSINAVPQTQVTATGLSVSTNSSTNINLGSATLSGSTAYTFQFSTSNPNGSTDDNTSNDTYTPAVTSTSLSGTYTIGGSSPDYATFNDAVADLNNYGVCGPVIFNVRQGTYNEQVEVTAVDNASATNTITFQPDPANTNPVVLTYGGHAFATNYVLNFYDAAHFRFTGLTMQCTNSGTYSRVVAFAQSNNDIILEDNILETTTTTSSSNYSAVVYMDDASGTVDSNIVFDGNTLLNGSAGIYIMGYNSSSREPGNRFDNNTVTGYYRYGVYIEYQTGFLMRGNTVRGSGQYMTALDISYCDGYTEISGNILESAGTGSSGLNLGIEMLSVDGTSGTHSMVYNNFITASAPGGTVEGIRFGSGSSYIDYSFNNIYVDGTNASSTSGIYFSGADEIGFYNNIVYVADQGNCIEYQTTSNQLYSDYNNLYSANGIIGRYSSTDYSSLATWNAATGIDANSISIDPVYSATSSPYDLHIGENSLAGTGIAFGGITVDIDGDARPNPPTIGADEIDTPSGCVTPIANNTVSGGGIHCYEATAGTVTGTVPTGGDGIYKYQWQISTDGSNYTDISTATGQSYAHPLLTLDTWYRRIVEAGDCADTSAATQFIIKQNTTWIGIINSNWHISGNWDCAEVPTVTTDVWIPAAPLNQPVILTDSLGHCKTLDMQVGSSLIIQTSGQLDIGR